MGKQELLNAFSEEILEEHSMDALDDAYNRILRLMKNRTRHVLQAWQSNFPDIKQFIRHLISAPSEEILSLRNCGLGTLQEIRAFQNALIDVLGIQVLIDKEEDTVADLEPPSHALPSNIDEVLPLFMETLDSLSTRSKNRMIWMLKECNNSLSIFYERICDPYCINTIPTVGRKTIPEIKSFFEQAKLWLLQFHDEEYVSSCVNKLQKETQTYLLGLPEGAMELLREKEATLGYFPIFAAIQMYLDSLPEEQKILIDGCLLIHQGQELPNRDEVANKLNLTTERVRQKRNNLISKLTYYFKTYSNQGLISKNPYRVQMTHYEEDVNASEGTKFSFNFITWVLGSVFDDLTLVGETLKSICGYYDADYYLCIVPTALTRLFDFKAFIEDMESRMHERRMGEEKVNLKKLISSHLRFQYCEDELPEIETTCRTILYLHFPVEVDMGYVIMQPNAYKTKPFILEEILRSVGRPMTLNELYEEFMYQYPERDSTPNSIRGAIGCNNKIVPLGRSSTYSLAEWSNSSYRGGTIREFVCEYLDSLAEPVAPEEDVCEYVRRFRPSTNESSISSNLMQEQSHKFVVMMKNGVRYYGYSSEEYGDEYKIIAGKLSNKRTVQESMRLLEEFILKEGRYPSRSKDDEEEYRLYRFVGNRRSACSRSAIPLEEIDNWIAFEERYREYDKNRPYKRRTNKVVRTDV